MLQRFWRQMHTMWLSIDYQLWLDLQSHFHITSLSLHISHNANYNSFGKHSLQNLFKLLAFILLSEEDQIFKVWRLHNNFLTWFQEHDMQQTSYNGIHTTFCLWETRCDWLMFCGVTGSSIPVQVAVIINNWKIKNENPKRKEERKRIVSTYTCVPH